MQFSESDGNRLYNPYMSDVERRAYNLAGEFGLVGDNSELGFGLFD